MNIFGKFPIVRMRQIFHNPGYAWFWIKRSILYKRTSYKFLSRYKEYSPLTPRETLAHIIEGKKSIIRFGDGEFGLLTGAGIYPPDSDWSQRYSEKLKREIEHLMALHDGRILLAFPPRSTVEARSSDAGVNNSVIPVMHTELRMHLWRFIDYNQIYGDCGVFVPQHNVDFDWERLHEYLNTRDVVIVTGGISRLFSFSLGRKMFFVETGKHDAFERYEDIYKAVAQLIAVEGLKRESTIIMASLGPTAGRLVLDFTKEGWQVWDTGHFFKLTDRKFLELGKGVRIFTKQLQVDSPEEAEQIFKKNIKFYEASQKIDELIFPKPLERTNTTIRFEQLDLPPLFSELLQSQIWELSWFSRVGGLLGSLHKELLGNAERGTVHGDLWAHNVAIGCDAIVLFDVDPPNIRSSVNDHLVNSRYMDIAAFLVSVLIGPGFRRFVSLLVSKRPFVKAAIDSYQYSADFKLESEKLYEYIYTEMRRWRDWNISYGHPILILALKYYVLSFVIWWQVRVCRILK